MIHDQVTKGLRDALENLKAEHASLSEQISTLESVLARMGAPAKRGPGRPKGSGVGKRGPGRPKGSGKKAAAPAKRGPGRPRKDTSEVSAKGAKAVKKRKKPKWTPEAREQARSRMRAYWAERKKSGDK